MPDAGQVAGPDSCKGRWTHPAAILVATDMNDLGRLMPFAMEQALETGARLILLHVLAAGTGIAVDAAGMPYYDPTGALDFAGKELEPWCAEARVLGISCHAVVREGNAAQQILAAARQFQTDRVLLGTRSRSKLGKLLLGSVAEQVLRSISLPVLTVGPEAYLPPQAQIEGDGGQPVVLHATTLKEASRPSAALACQIAASQGARLVLLHVMPPIDEMERKGLATGRDSIALQELRVLADETGAGCTSCVEPQVVHGNPTIEILAAASELRAKLIVLGATHHTPFERLARDHTVYRVLAHARCPVLTLREPLTELDEADTESLAAHK